MGPYFLRASRRLGRNRLPQGYVAVLDDEPALRQVVDELHAYAVAGAGRSQPRLGVLFRRVGVADQQAVNRQLIERFGAASLLDNLATFGIDEGLHYVIDTESVAPVWRRHADPAVEQQRGQSPIEVADLYRIPAPVRSRNIVNFEVTKGKPRIVYEDVSPSDTLVVVLEIQRSRGWLVVRTTYKRK